MRPTRRLLRRLSRSTTWAPSPGRTRERVRQLFQGLGLSSETHVVSGVPRGRPERKRQLVADRDCKTPA